MLRDGRIDFTGEFYRLEDCVLDPPPTRPSGPPLMVGSIGPRMLAISLPVVDSWNMWWSQYGNSVDGFVTQRERVEEAVAAAGREPGSVAATAAVLIRLPGGNGRVMGDYTRDFPEPVQGAPADIAGHLAALATAGASHLQLVLDPITQATIELAGEVLAELDRPT